MQSYNKIVSHPAFNLAYTLHGHTDYINALDLSQDGSILASSSRDGKVRLWFVENGKYFRTFNHDRSVGCLAWSPDGKIIASGTSNAIYLWDIETGKEIQVIKDISSGFIGIDWSFDGRTLAMASRDTIQLCNVGHNGSVKLYKVKDLECMAWSPIGGDLAFGTSSGVYILNTESLSQVAVFEKPSSKPIERTFPKNIEISIHDRIEYASIISHLYSQLSYLLKLLNGKPIEEKTLREIKELHEMIFRNMRKIKEPYDFENDLYPLAEIKYILRSSKKIIDYIISSQTFSQRNILDKRTISEMRQIIYKLADLQEMLNIYEHDGRRSEYLYDDIIDNLYENVNDKYRKIKDSGPITSLTWTQDGRYLSFASSDCTIHITDLKDEHPHQKLESHVDPSVSMAFLDEGRLLASLSRTGALLIWRTDTWNEVAHVEGIGILNINNNITSHPSLPIMCAPGQNLYSINIWNLNLGWLHDAKSAQPTIHYVNAKAVLLGDSSVGKSGLGIRIAESTFRTTESTHGAQFWHLPVKEVPGLPQNLQAELTLWDLAGQAEYRLIHQLFLDDTDAAMLLFDCSDPDDPFHGVPYWAKVLKKQAPPHAIKFLVSARCDVSPVTVVRQQINQMLAKYDLQEYFKTSAKSGDGVNQLFQQLLKNIPWQQLPRTSTPRLFQTIRDFLLKCKEDGKALIALDVIKTEISKLYAEDILTQREIDIVVGLLQARGLIYQLEPRPSMKLILTRPELVNQYASSIIQAARNHPFGIGAISERDVLIGEIPFTGFKRLNMDEEKIVLEATAELLIRHDLCFREMGLLVFPSQINNTRPEPKEMQVRTEVAYRFSGSIETIYASLVVRLSYTDYFHREDQWKYAVEFSRSGARLGFSMHSIEEGTGVLEIYFHPNINEFDKVTFIHFVTDHLRAKGIDIHEEIRLYCPTCNREINNRDAIEVRIENGCLDIPCQYCTSTVLISKSIEERYKHDIALIEKQSELAKKVGQRTEEVVSQFKADQEQYSQEMDQMIHILHLSDLHLENIGQADVHRTQLETDLIQELKIKRLEYLIISGDISNHAMEDEYRAGFQMLDNLVKRLGLDADHVVLVPGNHDMDRGSSRKAYPFTYREDLKTPLVEGKYIEAGNDGVLLRDEGLYRQRFANFNAHFYKRALGVEYPLDYVKQVTIIERPKDRILFLGLNSSWEIDHHFKTASINKEALSKALDYFNGKDYSGWLKIAVFHHPVNGKEMMNDEFMQLLVVHGFQICMHGHIHESLDSLFNYDKRGIRVIGAGAFGASSEEQVTGIPLQYNLLTFDPSKGEMTVSTRKKEKPEGSWSADSRWGDKNDPKPYYKFHVQDYQIQERTSINLQKS